MPLPPSSHSALRTMRTATHWCNSQGRPRSSRRATTKCHPCEVPPTLAEAHYPDAGDYWEAEQDTDQYPVRQGDLIGRPGTPEDWSGAVIVHPTCELVKKSVERIQVAQVARIAAYTSDESEMAKFVTGAAEK